jgi:hypothetical protein
LLALSVEITIIFSKKVKKIKVDEIESIISNLVVGTEKENKLSLELKSSTYNLGSHFCPYNERVKKCFGF